MVECRCPNVEAISVETGIVRPTDELFVARRVVDRGRIRAAVGGVAEDLLKTGRFQTEIGPGEDAGIRPAFEGVVAGRVVKPRLIRTAGGGEGLDRFESVKLPNGTGGGERGPPGGIGAKDIIAGRVVHLGRVCAACGGVGLARFKVGGSN